MASVSIVLATFNEEANLAACLTSTKGIADEIVIVDGTSQDKTVEIAKSFGAKVLVTENHPNFHINKQKAIDMATNDWVLQLDADEHLTEALIKEIKEKINDPENPLNGYWMPRKNYFLGRFLMKGGQYPDYTLRLYRNGKGRLPQKDVHEQAVVEGEVGYLNEALLHYPYKDFSAYLFKWRRYVNFTALQLKDSGKLSSPRTALEYLIVLPIYWFFLIYLRHKGFVDMWPGFVFAFYSGLRYPASYLAARKLKD